MILFQPANTPRRPQEGDSDEEEEDNARQRKARKVASKSRASDIERAEKVRRMKEELERKVLAEAEMASSNGISNEEREKIQQLLEESEANEVRNR